MWKRDLFVTKTTKKGCVRIIQNDLKINSPLSKERHWAAQFRYTSQHILQNGPPLLICQSTSQKVVGWLWSILWALTLSHAQHVHQVVDRHTSSGGRIKLSSSEAPREQYQVDQPIPLQQSIQVPLWRLACDEVKGCEKEPSLVLIIPEVRKA